MCESLALSDLIDGLLQLDTVENDLYFYFWLQFIENLLDGKVDQLLGRRDRAVRRQYEDGGLNEVGKFETKLVKVILHLDARLTPIHHWHVQIHQHAFDVLLALRSFQGLLPISNGHDIEKLFQGHDMGDK